MAPSYGQNRSPALRTSMCLDGQPQICVRLLQYLRNPSWSTLMLTALGAFQVSLCGASLTAAVAILAVEYLIYRHMRRHHREAFDQLGIRGPAFLWREDRNSEDTGFEDFVSSRKHATPDDSRLKSMLRLKSLI